MALEDFMLQPIANPVRKLNSDSGNQNNQFCELIAEINYACKKVSSKNWNLGGTTTMGDFFDYLGLPADANEHRDLAEKWVSEQ